MTHYFVGWDVGPWNCDEGNRQDAVALLAADAGAVVAPIRTNLREILTEFQREELLRQFLMACGIDPPETFRMTMAVSTPLAWPKPAVDLLTSRRTHRVPPLVDQNPILFRQTELALLELGHRPRSPVRDMIGSQSSKAIHFIRQAGFSPTSAGVWRVVSRTTGSVYEVIETIPSILKRSPTFERAFAPVPKHKTLAQVLKRADKNATADMQRALRCALLASMFALAPSKLWGPSKGSPEQEGWIWIPTDAAPPGKKR